MCHGGRRFELDRWRAAEVCQHTVRTPVGCGRTRPTGSVGGGVVFSSAASTLLNQRSDNGNYANAVSLKIGSTIPNGLNLGTASTATLTLTDGATFSGALTKASDGTWIIDQALTSSGGTTINARVLAATHTTGFATGTGAVVVNSGGTLASSGTVAGAVTVRSSGDAWRLTDKRSAARSRC